MIPVGNFKCLHILKAWQWLQIGFEYLTFNKSKANYWNDRSLDGKKKGFGPAVVALHLTLLL